MSERSRTPKVKYPSVEEVLAEIKDDSDPLVWQAKRERQLEKNYRLFRINRDDSLFSLLPEQFPANLDMCTSLVTMLRKHHWSSIHTLAKAMDQNLMRIWLSPTEIRTPPPFTEFNFRLKLSLSLREESIAKMAIRAQNQRPLPTSLIGGIVARS